MAETACLMRPFSYASGTLNEAKEGNPIHALRDSISFGRFVSESLAWEKWSSFSQNRYVEEAEKYSQPGSVAQKKAFFEAHYKRIAAKKAEALLEQANAAAKANHVLEPEAEFEGRVQNITTHNSETMNEKFQVAVKEEQEVKATGTNAGLLVDANGSSANNENGDLEVSKVERYGLLAENRVLVEDCIKAELCKKLGSLNNCCKVIESELNGKSQMEIPLLKKNTKSDEDISATSKKKPAHSSSSSSSVYSRASKLPSSPSKPIATSFTRKENNATPVSMNSVIDSSDKKRITPKSLPKSTIITPAREPNKLTSPTVRKIESSGVAASSSKPSNDCTTPSSSKPSKDCSTPLRTPTTAFVNTATKHSSATPQSENRRARIPQDSLASGSRTIGSKWRFLSVGCSKSPIVDKLQPPTVTASFSLRTEERAARRKKLEEKFNAKEVQKVQLQTKLKEKAESELKKLRQSLCFRARPLPDFYKERETPKNQIKKIPLIQPQSPMLGKNLSANTVQSTTSLPPPRPLIKKSCSKDVLEKSYESPIHSHTSLAEMLTHENTSPNIQLL